MATVIAPKNGQDWQEVWPEIKEDKLLLEAAQSALMLLAGWKTRSGLKSDAAILRAILIADEKSYGDQVGDDWAMAELGRQVIYLVRALGLHAEAWRE